MPYQFQKASPSMGDEVFAMYQSTVGVGDCHWDEGYPDRACVEHDLAHDFLYVLMDEAGRIVASISLLERDGLFDLPIGWTPANACALARLCVSPALQNRHLAAIVLSQIEMTAAKLGYDSARLLAAQSNPAALRVYAREGYRPLGHVNVYDTDFECFEKMLV